MEQSKYTPVHCICIDENTSETLAKKWLFWFCEVLACVSGKTKCATYVLAEFHFFCEVVEK
jgi:hypothetical protein